MTFTIPATQVAKAASIIRIYFSALEKQGPGGMRSQCYAADTYQKNFVHIKSFKKESVANQHFRSLIFKEYISGLASICGEVPQFSRLQQQQTFESIY
jgi:hypothetical protein